MGREREAVGQQRLATTLLANVLLPHILPTQGLSPQNLHTVHFRGISLVSNADP